MTGIRNLRDWLVVGANLLFFPIFLVFEVVHYVMFREWYSFSPRELWQEVFRYV